MSRAALVVWTVFFSAYDTVQGVATGILIRHAKRSRRRGAGRRRRGIDFMVNDSQLAGNVSAVWVVATVAWVVVAIGAAIALHKAGAGKAVVAAACLSAVFAVHVAPAAIGLLALFLAGVVRERQRTKSAVGGPAIASAVGSPGARNAA